MFQFLSTLNLAPLELLLNHSRVCEDEAVQCQTCTARTQIALASAYSDMLEASWNGTWSSYSSCSMFLWGTLSVISLFRLPTSIPLQSSCLRSPHRRVMQLAASVGPMMHPQTQASFHSVLNVGWWWGTKSEWRNMFLMGLAEVQRESLESFCCDVSILHYGHTCKELLLLNIKHVKNHRKSSSVPSACVFLDQHVTFGCQSYHLTTSNPTPEVWNMDVYFYRPASVPKLDLTKLSLAERGVNWRDDQSNHPEKDGF